MRLIVLGTGAGGGCPQWNCGCDNCDFARNNPERARTTDSLAVSYELNQQNFWAIVNPGADLRHQLSRHPELQPPRGGPLRDTPIKSVILTDGELDHCMGLINLREGAELKVFATASVLELIKTRFPISTILRNYARLEFCRIVPGVPFQIGENSEFTAIGLSGRQPRYAGGNGEQETKDAVIGLKFKTISPAATYIAYAPQIGVWDKEVESLLDGSDIVIVDGTFYTSEELPSLGLSAGRAEEMGHLPLSGAGGILNRLKEIKAGVKLLTHINNTNPILRDNSPERQAVENAGVKIAVDGMCFSSGKTKGKFRD